jgi:hypothetical protein
MLAAYPFDADFAGIFDGEKPPTVDRSQRSKAGRAGLIHGGRRRAIYGDGGGTFEFRRAHAYARR